MSQKILSRAIGKVDPVKIFLRKTTELVQNWYNSIGLCRLAYADVQLKNIGLLRFYDSIFGSVSVRFCTENRGFGFPGFGFT